MEPTRKLLLQIQSTHEDRFVSYIEEEVVGRACNLKSRQRVKILIRESQLWDSIQRCTLILQYLKQPMEEEASEMKKMKKFCDFKIY